MMVKSRIKFVYDNTKRIYRIECPDMETLIALFDLIKLSNEALEDCEEDA